MRNIAKILASCFVILVANGGNLQGDLITINLTAEVWGVNDWDNLLEGQINVGDIMTGSYTYWSGALDSGTGPTIGMYQYWADPSGIRISAGGFVFKTDPENVDFLITILDGENGHDIYSVGSYNNLPLSNGIPVERIGWGLADYSCAAISSDALPTTAPVLEDWESNYLQIAGPKGIWSIQATVTSIEIVPEPASAVMMGIGAVLLAMRRKGL